MSNLREFISSVGSCTVYSQCTEQFATIYIHECVIVAKIAKFNIANVSHFTASETRRGVQSRNRYCSKKTGCVGKSCYEVGL